MKKMFFPILILFLVALIERHSLSKATIVSVSIATETITIEDRAGYLYDFYGTDFKEGDVVSVLFDNNNTETDRSDDRVVKVW